MMEWDDQNCGVVHAASSPGNAVGVQVVERRALAVERGDGAIEVGEIVQAWVMADSRGCGGRDCFYGGCPTRLRLRERERDEIGRDDNGDLVMMVDGGSRGMRLREMRVIWIRIGGDE
ncbi:hypothetical protein Q3G72_030987 [Acer saccharum]|nr:hypothetical protein Q3G72_030987 [Acer saccharum]